jgi:hypothetical protein
MRRDPDKARDWRRRSKPLRRGKIERSRSDTQPKTGKPKAARRIRAVSTKTGDARAAAKPIRDLYLAAYPFCEIAAMLGTGGCFGELHVHEPWGRGAGGPIDDPRNMATACDHHNTAASQDPDMMRRCEEFGLRVKRSRGPAWLAEGGRTVYRTKEAAVEALMLRVPFRS